jgi:hypothetical protein
MFPSSVELLCFWLTDLAKNVTFKTVKNYLRAMRHLHVERGYDCTLFNDIILKELIKGVKRKYGDKERKRALPVTNQLLSRIRSKQSQLIAADNHNARMRLAAMAVAVNGLFRIGEVTVSSVDPNRYPRMKHLLLKDDHIIIHLPISKTDQFGNGADVRISNAAAVNDFLVYLRGCSKAARRPSAPLFAWESGKPLSRKHLLSFSERLLVEVGVDLHPWYGISFRRGGATSLALAGIPDRLIKIIAGGSLWCSHAISKLTLNCW